MKKILIITLCFLGFYCVNSSFAEEKLYIGSIACKDCHEEEYSNFMKYSKKVTSYESIKKMEKKLTSEEYQTCFECHTTGYGKKGGFISEDKTPELKNTGCEVCHGPGNIHAASEDPDDIITDISMDNCNTCHSESRIQAFDFKPLLFGGAH